MRFKPEVLKIQYKGKNINDVLNFSIDEAISFFSNHSSIMKQLIFLKKVGLGYLKLGQSSVSLSGGEAQRIKLSKELAKTKQGHCLYILDEPSTGLHMHDTNKLIQSIQQLVDKGNSVIVIEHNLDIILNADYIIDMGPDGGNKGGKVVAQGPLIDVLKNQKSETTKYLNIQYQRLKKRGAIKTPLV
jgi:excinuclease ABC subunit A